MKYVLFFGECGEQDIDLIGKKGVNLSLLFKRGFQVPPGFILSGNIFDIIKKDKEIRKVIQNLFEGKPYEKTLQDILNKFEFSEEIEDEITEAYLSLSVDLNMNASSLLETKEEFVAVRSSIIDKKNKFPKLSHKTVLNVKGKKRIFKAILEDYYSMIIQAARKYQTSADIDELNLAIIIQKMVNSQKSGVAISVNEEDDNKEEIIVKACFGLGEGLSSGSVFPDIYRIDKKTLSINDLNVAEKQFEFVKDIDSDETVKHRLGEKSLKQVLNNNEIIEIARIIKKISNAFEKQVKIEWAIKNNTIYVLQMKDIRVEHKETVEMEILPEKEDIPEVIDISDADLDDDLQVLEEIERYENQDETEEEKIVSIPEVAKPEEVIEKQDEMPEYNIEQPEIYNLNQEKIEEKKEDFSEAEIDQEDIEETDGEEEKVENEGVVTPLNVINRAQESEKEEREDQDLSEESIFENYDTFKVEEETVEKPPINNFKELAYLNAANTIVFCHMAIKDKLRQRLSKHVSDVPDDFKNILDLLREYETIEDEQDLRKLNRIKQEYIMNKKYPEPEDVALGLKLI